MIQSHLVTGRQLQVRRLHGMAGSAHGYGAEQARVVTPIILSLSAVKIGLRGRFAHSPYDDLDQIFATPAGESTNAIPR
jgi:hypothetical protein